VNGDHEETSAKTGEGSPNTTRADADPWSWVNSLLEIQPRDILSWLALVASVWTLWIRIQEISQHPDRLAAIGTILLLLALASLAITELLDWWRRGHGYLDIPPKIAWFFTMFALLIICLFYSGKARLEAIFGGLEIGALLYVCEWGTVRFQGSRGMDSTTIASGAFAGLLLGCGPFALVVLFTSLLVAGSIGGVEWMFKNSRDKVHKREESLFLSVAPLLLVVSVVMMPGVRGVVSKALDPAPKAAEEAVETTIKQLLTSDRTGVMIQPAVRDRLKTYYAKASPILQPTVGKVESGGAQSLSAFRHRNADFVFIVEPEGKKFKTIQVYERPCWCGL
jgi:hypothetical protein